MTPRINRRTFFIGMVSTAVTVLAGTEKAQSEDMRGSVTYQGGKVIPKGRIEISLENPATQAETPVGNIQKRIESDGRSHQIAFSLAQSASLSAAPTQRVVAHLKREDGWLLARGSAQVEVDLPVSITLSTVMY